MNKKFKALAAVAVSAALAMTGCHFVGKPDDDGFITDAEKNTMDETIVAEINGQDLTIGDFNMLYYDISSYYQQYATYMGASDWESMEYPGSEEEYAGMTLGEYARQYTIDQASLLIMGQQRAKEFDILVDDDVVDDANDMKENMINSIESNGGSYDEYLELYGVSDYTVDKYLQRSIVVNELIDRLSQEGEVCYVSDKEVEDSFIKASHVLIMIDDDTTDEQALAKANEVIARLDAGDDMAALIKEYGEDPGMEEQDYYVFTEGEMVDEFYQGAKALEPGQYSKEPVKTSYGYHVIYRYPLTSSDEGYEDVTSKKDDVKQSLVAQKFRDAINQWVGTASIKVNDEVLDKALAEQKEKQAKLQQEMADAAAQQAADAAGTDGDIPEMQADGATEDNAVVDETPATDGDAAPEGE